MKAPIASGDQTEPETDDGAPADLRSPSFEGGDRSMDPEQMTIEDIAEAEASRPDVPDETEDGLDDLEESVRHEAEDVPADERGGFVG